MKKLLLSLIILGSQYAISQERATDKPPVFPGCESLDYAESEICFYNKVQDFVYDNFKTPDKVSQDNFTGNTIILFEVSDSGEYRILHTNSAYQEVKDEIIRVFAELPKSTPASYNGNPTYSKYTLNLAFPLQKPIPFSMDKAQSKSYVNTDQVDIDKPLTELDDLKLFEFKNPQFSSKLNIPFSHSLYAQFDQAMNQVGANNHTAQKPYSYAEVAKYYDFEKRNQEIKLDKQSWWGRKLFNENLVAVQGENYWFTLNPVLDLRLGKDTDSKASYTYNNSRAIQVQGALGKELHFSTTIYESQGRFADYYNQYAMSIRPSGGNPAVIPGIGIAKQFKTDAFDFPSADAQLTYTPSDFINLQLGYGRNFVGDGYRSLLHGDGASTHPYFKINTTFWKLKYTNTYMWLKDLRPEVTVDGAYATKYIASHYLSWNATNRLNIGVFESVVWSNQNNRGFDFNFVNPILFYRTVEFNSSSKAGNALLGLTAKYKVNNQINVYGQFLVDEFSFNEIKERNQSWQNKFGYQIGVKYYNAFNVENLLLQAEANIVRPYVYSHSDPLTNYAHNNQSMGHNWGANFKEMILVARYHKGRYFADAKLTYGIRGLDFNTPNNNYNYGGNIYLDYENNRPFNNGVKAGQGNETKIIIADMQAGYLVNPSTNLKIFANLTYRSFNPNAQTETAFNQNTTWFSIGLRSDIFNWYFDY